MSIPSQVLNQLQAIFEQDSQADCVALVWPEALAEQDIIHDMNGYRLRVVYCSSELAIRKQLVDHGNSGSDNSCRLVLLSAFDHSRLANDVLARLWRNEPKRISPWRALQQILKVRQIDPRLTGSKYRWIAKTLLSAHDAYKNEIQFGEVLDQDKAWQALVCALLGFHAENVDLPSLFQWSLSGKCDTAYAALPEEMKTHLGDWLRAGLPDFETLVLRICQQGQVDNLLAIGLACSVMYHRELLEQSKSALKAREKLINEQNLIAFRAVFNERYLGGSFANSETLEMFGRQALTFVEQMLNEQSVKGQQNPMLHQSFSQAEQMLASLNLTPALIYSNILPGGFRLRLDTMASVLEKCIKGQSINSAEVLLGQLKKHNNARSAAAAEQVMRVDMAIRLCKWLQGEDGKVPDAAFLLSNYIDHGSFADWGRSKIWQGDVHEGLSKVYQKLSEAVCQRREQHNQAITALLPAIARGDQQKDLLPVEQVLDQLVAPLAKGNLVLLLVLDGMSQAVYRELASDVVQHNWLELQRESNPIKGLLSTLPSITKASRCSLFSGALCEGTAVDEKKAFAGHSQLKNLASTKFPPRLYHKADLEQAGTGALANEVRSVLAGTEHRITGVVINAIDDQLSSNAQLTMNWTVGTIALLRQVLEAARESGRIVIMTSDHGHVLDHDMKGQGKDNGGERYKPGSAKVETGEVKVSGARVLAENQSVVLPWSEKVRYTSRKMGYHGGGSLQEVVIPLGIYVSGGALGVPGGWREVPRYVPDWWQTKLGKGGVTSVETPVAPPVTSVTSKTKSKKAQAKAEVMDDMFAVTAESSAATDISDDWKVLLDSAVYKQVKSRAGRTAIKDEQLVQMLQLLEVNGNQLMMTVLIQSLGIPKLRMRGFLAGVQKLLNVDGYPILSIDRASETVKLNVELLKTQFELV
ncbi:BREX-2 system phosphatase PglZ [Endozoicomonas sp. 4G]|uniref:BREX-2 system phosphatase PglZ n=1 Tax=Endozoicomonas sp. 4G TaxID=2872754 RepID=UPI0020788087|nr:BREX-2 system phosphatase PglZ [Endozoicomonas sp. 4G]